VSPWDEPAGEVAKGEDAKEKEDSEKPGMKRTRSSARQTRAKKK
jgi:hypothetical protein